MPSTAAAAKRALRAHADPERAEHSRRYFRTGPGEYGEGDVFIGLKVPQVRTIAREHRDLPFAELAGLLASQVHEDRFLALLVLVERARKAAPDDLDAIARFYLKHVDAVDQWDLIDTSAPHVLGPWLQDRSRATLTKLARSPRWWRRRVAMLTTLHLIRNGEMAETLRLAKLLLADDHDLVQKAVGWILREVGERERATLEGFLEVHAARMPRTMLRYAVEKLPVAAKRRYMALK